MTPADGGGDGPAVRPGRHKAMGVDLGERRIGVAVSDSGGALAFPLCVIDRAGDPAADHRRLADMVAEHEVVTVVVGLPLSLDGSRGPAAQRALSSAAWERQRNGAPAGSPRPQKLQHRITRQSTSVLYQVTHSRA